MNYVRLGKTGLKVSNIALGMMTYGDPKLRAWSLEIDEAEPFVKRALEAGINFFDTANAYSAGPQRRDHGRTVGQAGATR